MTVSSRSNKKKFSLKEWMFYFIQVIYLVIQRHLNVITNSSFFYKIKIPFFSPLTSEFGLMVFVEKKKKKKGKERKEKLRCRILTLSNWKI